MLNLNKNNINLYKVIIYNKIDNAININTFSDYISNLINNNLSTLTHTISNNNIYFSKWLIKKIKLKIENIDVIKYKLYNSLGLFCEYYELELNNDINNKKLEINKLLYQKINDMYPNLFYLWLKINLVKNREDYIFKITKLNTHDLTSEIIFKFNNNFEIITLLDTIKQNVKLIYNFFNNLICKLYTPLTLCEYQNSHELSEYSPSLDDSSSTLLSCDINKLELINKNLNSFEILKLFCDTLIKLEDNTIKDNIILLNNQIIDKTQLSLRKCQSILKSS